MKHLETAREIRYSATHWYPTSSWAVRSHHNRPNDNSPDSLANKTIKCALTKRWTCLACGIHLEAFCPVSPTCHADLCDPSKTSMDLATQVSSKKVKKQNGPNIPKSFKIQNRMPAMTGVMARGKWYSWRSHKCWWRIWRIYNNGRVMPCFAFPAVLSKSFRYHGCSSTFLSVKLTQKIKPHFQLYKFHPEPPDMMSNKKMISFSQLAASHLGATSSKRGQIESWMAQWHQATNQAHFIWVLEDLWVKWCWEFWCWVVPALLRHFICNLSVRRCAVSWCHLYSSSSNIAMKQPNAKYPSGSGWNHAAWNIYNDNIWWNKMKLHGSCAHLLLELLGIENHLHFWAVLTPQSQTLTWTEILGRLKVEDHQVTERRNGSLHKGVCFEPFDFFKWSWHLYLYTSYTHFYTQKYPKIIRFRTVHSKVRESTSSSHPV